MSKKLNAGNSKILKAIKTDWNSAIYKKALAIANQVGESAAIEFVLTEYYPLHRRASNRTRMEQGLTIGEFYRKG